MPEPAPLDTPAGTAPLVAPPKRPRDRVLPILIVGSLVIHALVFLPSLLSHQGGEAEAPRAIPVEVVQEAPPAPKPQEAPPAPKPQEAPPAPKPPPPAAGATPPRPEPAKSEPAKSEPPKPEPKPEPPKPEPPKPQPPKPEPPKPSPDPSRANVEQRMKDLLGAMPAIAMPGEDPSGTDAVSYEQLVMSRLAKAKSDGRREGVPGVAYVKFVLNEAGGVASASVVRSSGDPTLDGDAVAMVYRGAPYPAPPPGARRDYTFGLRFSQLP